MTWLNGPTLAGLKVDAQLDTADTTKDAAYQMTLDAAIAYVMRARKDWNYDGDLSNPNPAPTADFVLGTYRLAYRWHTRRRSPDGIVSMGDLGSSRVPTVDQDIARLLGIDRYRALKFA